jgi:hypothetical protein
MGQAREGVRGEGGLIVIASRSVGSEGFGTRCAALAMRSANSCLRIADRHGEDARCMQRSLERQKGSRCGCVW